MISALSRHYVEKMMEACIITTEPVRGYDQFMGSACIEAFNTVASAMILDGVRMEFGIWN